jgi:hypothetical protein
MTPSEAAKLLSSIAAFDKRTIGEVDARAWGAALHDVPLDADAFAAVARYFGTPPKDGEARRWLEPHHVKTMRRKIREERIEAANAFYDGNPNEGALDFVARRRAQLAAAADGTLPPQPIPYALSGPPHPNVAKAITGIGRTVPPLEDPNHPPPYVPEMARKAIAEAVPRFGDRYERTPELAIACSNPNCRALPKRPCRRPSGKELRDGTHASRSEDWTVATAACPACKAQPGAECSPDETTAKRRHHPERGAPEPAA